MRHVRAALAAFLGLAVLPAAHADTVTSTFENLGLAPGSYINGDPTLTPPFPSSIDGNVYNNNYTIDPTYGGAWYGWSFSTMTDTTTPGFTNQYSSITGGGANGSATYGVALTYGAPAFDNIYDPTNPITNPFHPSDSTITLAAGATPDSIAITNTTYSYLTMRDGDGYGFAHAFTKGDYQLLDIRGFDASGKLVGTVDFYLANYLSDNKNDWYIVDTWKTIDLASLKGSTELRFGIQSSQNDPTVGVNTPAYFAADNFTLSTAIPEPSSVVMMGLGLAGLVILGTRRRMLTLVPCVLAVMTVAPAYAGSFDPQVGQPGSLGVNYARSSSIFTEWASSVVSINRGPMDISNPGLGLASYGNPSNCLGPNGTPVSLGDGGSITVSFNTPIANGAGADFAVFENGFLTGGPGMAFLELAFVEVSSDGVNFFRFASISETQTTTQVGGFGAVDASNLNNLAGKYINGYGTPFDLSELAGTAGLDINHVTEVRIVDVVGSINPAYGSKDSHGNLINDPWSTPFASSGFDLTGVGVIHMAAAIPEPSSVVMALAAGIALAAAPLGRAASRRRAARRALTHPASLE
ncbi:DUF4465 domain-containing protein [Aquisphaera insulae]|uniref:DUF4465 domain-containing protein n=1 Tax=Aquisphaera insulae TaxID=2712864 RepID=UPI0013EB1869|nr:DUF4465 domain-containing protein [Aquisphaera insulae]